MMANKHNTGSASGKAVDALELKHDNNDEAQSRSFKGGYSEFSFDQLIPKKALFM